MNEAPVVVGDVMVDVVGAAGAGALASGSDTAAHARWRRGGAGATVALNIARAGGRVALAGRG